ncbi:MAG: MFS transporter [Methanobacteriota archaeon]|nr:MAG: MFS transporter [Euryarchaeota archaeon]
MEPHRKAIFVLCVSVLPLMICTGIVYTILSIYLVDELGFSKSTVGALFALGAGMGAVLSPFIGKASDRYGRKPILIGAAAAFLCVFASYAFLTETWQYILIMTGEGVAWVSIGTGAMAYIADISPSKERGRSLSVYEATWNIGWVLGPLTGGVLADSIGFQRTFLVGTSVIAVSIALLAFVVKETSGARAQAQING